MIGYIWAFMVISSIIASVFTGTVPQTVNAAFDGANQSVETIVGFLGVMCMWTGLMKIAERSGLISVFSRFISPFTSLIFPRIKKDSPAQKAISMNIVANILGLGNAATPLGINAMERLNETNPDKKTATNEMCMLVVLNTASIQLIPSTLIALRTSFGSQNPSEIIVPVWISSVITAVIAISVTTFFGRRRKSALKKRKEE